MLTKKQRNMAEYVAPETPEALDDLVDYMEENNHEAAFIKEDGTVECGNMEIFAKDDEIKKHLEG
ncbi:MAG: hypothetical protein MK033_10465 [Candidatus Caenarcaniphilales bacterium]|nr:hypothetical protein [Candidatus Caenarcaniphilales bacterium]